MSSATSTPDLVRALSGSKADDPTVQIFIDAASALIDSIAGCLSSYGLHPCDMDIACTFLAAHLLASSGAGGDAGTKSKERFEQYSVEYVVGGYSGKGVMGTTYGQAANSLTRGCLENLDKPPAAIVFTY